MSRTWHGDGDWKWANETAKRPEELPGIYDGGGDTGTCTCTLIHNVSSPTPADTSMRRTRSRVVEVRTVLQGQEDTLQTVAAALATGLMPFGSSGLRQKRKGPRDSETMTWDVGKSVAVPEGEGLGRHRKTRRLLPIFDRPMPLHTGPLDPEQAELITVAQGLLGEKVGEFSMRPPAEGPGDAPSLMDTGKKRSDQVGGSNASACATCSTGSGKRKTGSGIDSDVSGLLI